MVASLSHDLKTPLMSISAYAEALSVDAPLEPSERRTTGMCCLVMWNG